MSWVFERPSLIAIEVGWHLLFGLPFLVVCWIEAQRILAVLPLDAAGLTEIDAQNPWVAVVQITDAWAHYQPHVMAVLHWLLPVASVGLGGDLRVGSQPALDAPASKSDLAESFRPLQMIALQAAWLAALGATCWGWFRSIEWVAATHITAVGEPDLVGYFSWVIFLTLGFFTAWALVNWVLSIAPLLMLLEERSALSSLGQSLRLGKAFSGKLMEINLVMGIVKLALIVLAMVLSAAPLPFSDQLGSGLHAWDFCTGHALLLCRQRLFSGGEAEGICGVLEDVPGRGVSKLVESQISKSRPAAPGTQVYPNEWTVESTLKRSSC